MSIVSARHEPRVPLLTPLPPHSSIPLLNPLLQLLALLSTPSAASGAFQFELADKLRTATRKDFHAVFEKFMVAFGRMCYGEVPDLQALFEDPALPREGAAPDGDDWWAEFAPEPRTRQLSREGEAWETELDRAGGARRLLLFVQRLLTLSNRQSSLATSSTA